MCFKRAHCALRWWTQQRCRFGCCRIPGPDPWESLLALAICAASLSFWWGACILTHLDTFFCRLILRCILEDHDLRPG